ncbi:MAG: hypothetical protein ACT4TC_05085 [Myxococcaceae bacterium]
MKKSLLAVLVGLTFGCGGGSKGKVQVFVEPEETIPEGLQPGTDPENVQDGWTIEYEKFLVAIGNVRAAQSAVAGSAVSDPKTWIVDLMNVPAGGFVITTFDNLEATRWDRVGFDLPRASAGSGKATGLSDADYALMVDNGYNVFVRGKATKSDGQSCKPDAPADCVPRPEVVFTFPLKAATSFDDCASATGETGFAVPSGGTVQVKPTIHGDHWFFTNLTQGVERTERKAQWLADCDLNRNGEVTAEELRAVHASQLLTDSKGYGLSGAISPIVSVYDYVEVQARTLGDYQGEGECQTRAVLP